MTSTVEAAATPWRFGPFKGKRRGLTFGAMYEDSNMELSVFQPGSRVFCIAGAGCTARTLAEAGHQVTAVDIHPLQIAYAQARAAGGPQQMGSVEKLMARGRTFARLFGWSRRKLSDFLELSDPAEQLEYWDDHLDTHRWRWTMDTLLSPRLLGLGYSGPFLESLPCDFGKQIRDRLRRGWARHANKDNPYASLLLLGIHQNERWKPAATIQFHCADAAEFLEGCSPASFDAFALSNIGDGAPEDYMLRLRAAVRYAAAPGAVVVMRSFVERSDSTLENLAAFDRSLLWGTVEVQHIESGV